MPELLVNDWSGRLANDLPVTAGAGDTFAVTPPAPASAMGGSARARVGTEIVTVTITSGDAWTIVAREAEDADRYPKRLWAAGTAVDLVLTAGGLSALVGAALPDDVAHLSQEQTFEQPQTIRGGLTVTSTDGSQTVLSQSATGTLTVKTLDPAQPAGVFQAAVGQTGDLFQWKNSVGTAVARVDSIGRLVVGGGSPVGFGNFGSGFTEINNANGGTLYVRNADPMVVYGGRVYTSDFTAGPAGTPYFAQMVFRQQQYTGLGRGLFTAFTNPNAAANDAMFVAVADASQQRGAFEVQENTLGGDGMGYRKWGVDKDGNVNFYGATDNASPSSRIERMMVELVQSLTDSAPASWQSRLDVYVSDFAARRVALSVGANGSGPVFSVFGAAPAAQQTGGAATAGANYGTTEQGMLQKAYDALRTFGFLT